MRLRVHPRDEYVSAFQFTHPGKGATIIVDFLVGEQSVSIHAPWEGCDLTKHKRYYLRQGFNSRTLGRVRQFFGKTYISINEFQFTHPGKGATVSVRLSSMLLQCFNSRTLGRVRQITAIIRLTSGQFQFTHPGKGATTNTSLAPQTLRVSIHAPWEGCDLTSLKSFQ